MSRFDMLCAQAHWVGSKPICRVMQLKLHKPTMAIGYSLRICAWHVDSTNPGPRNFVFRSKHVRRHTWSSDPPLLQTAIFSQTPFSPGTWSTFCTARKHFIKHLHGFRGAPDLNYSAHVGCYMLYPNSRALLMLAPQIGIILSSTLPAPGLIIHVTSPAAEMT